MQCIYPEPSPRCPDTALEDSLYCEPHNEIEEKPLHMTAFKYMTKNIITAKSALYQIESALSIGIKDSEVRLANDIKQMLVESIREFEEELAYRGTLQKRSQGRSSKFKANY